MRPRIFDAPRVDYVHEDRRASLGLATLQREALAFHSAEDRARIVHDPHLEVVFFRHALAHLPPALSLADAAKELAEEERRSMCAAKWSWVRLVSGGREDSGGPAE